MLVDLASLSVDELQHMEGSMRENIMERIRFLERTQTQISQLIHQMSQYHQIVKTKEEQGGREGSREQRDLETSEPSLSAPATPASASSSSSPSSHGGPPILEGLD